MATPEREPTSQVLRWLDGGAPPGAETDRLAAPPSAGAPAESECVRECRKAHLAEGGTPASRTGPSTEFLEQASRRLGTVAIVIIVLTVFLIAQNLVIFELLRWTPPMELGLIRGTQVTMLALSIALLLVARSKRPAPEWKLNAGLAYEVLGALAIAAPSFYCPRALMDHDFGHVSWVCVWIVFFPLVAPAPMWRMVAASFLAASAGPVILLLFRAPGTELPGGAALFAAFAPGYICAAIALAPSYVMNQLGREVSSARREARRLGSYQLVERLGTGGMGEVWRAEHSMLARPAAVKLIRAELLRAAAQGEDGEATALARFEREARATAALRSPHTVSLYDFGVADDGSFYYVMELLEGLDLETLVERFGPLPPARAVHLLAQACDSLAEAHAAGLVHRDVKPANIYACRLGLELDFVKVLDFGLVAGAKFARAPNAARLTGEGFIVGTPAFMAPEMVAEGDVDLRADIYALGCVGYWLLTGRHVFESEKPMQIMIDHARTQPVPPSRRYERPLPPRLEDAIMACLAKAPADRPQDALALKRLLLEALGDERWTQDHARLWWEAKLPALAVPVGPNDPTRTPRRPGVPTATSLNAPVAAPAGPAVISAPDAEPVG